MSHRDEFCGVLVTGNAKRLDYLTLHPTQKEWLHQSADSTDDRIKLGMPDRIDERDLFLPILPTSNQTNK